MPPPVRDPQGTTTTRIREIDRHIGRQLRRFREARGYSQATMGRAIGLSFQQIQKYESGANRLSASRLILLARALGVEPQDLMAGLPARLGGRGPAGRAASLEPLPKASELETLRLLRVLPAPTQTLFRRLVRSIAGQLAAAEAGRGVAGR